MPEHIKIRVVPNAPKSAAAGAYGDGVKIKIKAPAMDGKANAELIKFLAGFFGDRDNLRRDIARQTRAGE